MTLSPNLLTSDCPCRQILPVAALVSQTVRWPSRVCGPKVHLCPRQASRAAGARVVQPAWGASSLRPAKRIGRGGDRKPAAYPRASDASPDAHDTRYQGATLPPSRLRAVARGIRRPVKASHHMAKQARVFLAPMSPLHDGRPRMNIRHGNLPSTRPMSLLALLLEAWTCMVSARRLRSLTGRNSVRPDHVLVSSKCWFRPLSFEGDRAFPTRCCMLASRIERPLMSSNTAFSAYRCVSDDLRQQLCLDGPEEHLTRNNIIAAVLAARGHFESVLRQDHHHEYNADRHDRCGRCGRFAIRLCWRRQCHLVAWPRNWPSVLQKI